ncbi:hypothetical protein FA95DRAFT_1557807 [Auriscalpium vulgare]|uniref:Uncharacterized protein n=1 Tax=Auriscalpium vulgare TaxID=40419 RepID=A0ACB8RYG7_9AGAM|nr:hypothetical protein FA95DRAFT_1557807 [Auriscalpium vulgare]
MAAPLTAVAHAQLEALRQTILAQSNEIEQQQKKLENMQAVVEGQNELIKARHTGAGSKSDGESEEGYDSTDEADDRVLPEPLCDRDTSGNIYRDTSDNILRCSACAWEVIKATCVMCHLEHNVDSYGDAFEQKERGGHRDVTMDDDTTLLEERLPWPRGATPLDPLDPTDAASVPSAYASNVQEYTALLKRGASREMCEAFQLQYTYSGGIVAWADWQLFADFSGPGMKDGDQWKILLGRRVPREVSDKDGSRFMEALLEEAVVFPLTRQDDCGSWETVLEEPGVWVTRPRPAEDAQSGDAQSELGQDDDASETDEIDTGVVVDIDRGVAWARASGEPLFADAYEAEGIDDEKAETDPKHTLQASDANDDYDSEYDSADDDSVSESEGSSGTSAEETSEEEDEEGEELVHELDDLVIAAGNGNASGSSSRGYVRV